jgi:uncharacterized protein YegP (UPF0339 family)
LAATCVVIGAAFLFTLERRREPQKAAGSSSDDSMKAERKIEKSIDAASEKIKEKEENTSASAILNIPAADAPDKSEAAGVQAEEAPKDGKKGEGFSSETPAPAEQAVLHTGQTVAPADGVNSNSNSSGTNTSGSLTAAASAAAAAVLIAPSGEKPGILGYYYIKQTPDGGYMFNLKTAAHEIIATSEIYSTLAACRKGIQSVAKNAPAAVIEDQTEPSDGKIYAPKFELYAENTGEFRFRLKAANYEVLITSQPYKQKSLCRNGIDSAIHNAETRKIIVEDAETSKKRESLRAEIVLAEKITAEQADSLIDDETARVLIETMDSDDETSKKLNSAIVYTDTLGENFENGDLVNVAVLIKKGLVPRSTRHIQVIGRGTLGKALTVEANQFSPNAVKMIVLTGGTAVKTND